MPLQHSVCTAISIFMFSPTASNLSDPAIRDEDSSESSNARMEMTGDLADFSLTDILQMLSLTRKTGMLFLESKHYASHILIEDGKITYASLRPGASFAERLVRQNKISAKVLAKLKSFGMQHQGIWSLQNLIVESGLLTKEELHTIARRYLTDVIGNLISIKEGKFGIELNRVEMPEPFSEIRLPDGVEVGEVLLTAASEKDEAEKIVQTEEADTAHWADDFDFELLLSGKVQNPHAASNVIPFNDQVTQETTHKEKLPPTERALLLLSLLSEMREQSSEIEIILLIMRYASEVASRGILFAVKDEEIYGFGQFNVTSRNKDLMPDDAVRAIHIPVGEGTLFDKVLWTGQPFIGTLQQGHGHDEIFKSIGGLGANVTAFAMPMFCNNKASWVFYGDNYPDQSNLEGLDGLVALVTQGALVLEKMALEQKLKSLLQ
jgi:hypothetical protein